MKLIILFFLFISCKVKTGSYSSDEKLCLDPVACFEKYAACDGQNVLGGQEEGSHFLTFATTNSLSAQQFALESDKLIYSISIGLAQSSDPDGEATLELRANCKDDSNNNIPCEDYLTRTHGIKMDTFSITTPITNQEFIFDEPMKLKKDKNYWIVVRFPLEGQAGKQIFQYAKSGNPLANFDYLYKTYTGDNWITSYSTYDMVFLLNECNPGLD